MLLQFQQYRSDVKTELTLQIEIENYVQVGNRKAGAAKSTSWCCDFQGNEGVTGLAITTDTLLEVHVSKTFR